MSRILLDTNAYSNFLKGDHRVKNALFNADEILFSVIVIAELFYGFRLGNKEVDNRRVLNRFLEKPSITVLQVSIETSEIFSECKAKLKAAGSPIPINDIWIGAQAIEQGAVLITYDSHFDKVSGVRRWNPSLYG